MQATPPYFPDKLKLGQKWVVPVTYVFTCVYSIAAVLLFLFHQQLFFYTWSDENINLYVAKAVADGLSLYGDIPSARPPMALFPVVLLIKSGLEPLAAGRTVVFLTTVATGIVLWFLGKKFWGEWAGLAASLMFLLGPAAANRTTFTGIELVAFWCLLTVGFMLLKRPWWSGLFAAMAVSTGQHSAVLVGGTLILSIFLLKKHFYRFVLPFLGATLLIFLLVYFMGGHHFFQYLVSRHLYHVAEAADVTKVNLGWWMKVWFLENLYLWLLILISLARNIWGRGITGTRFFLDYAVQWPWLQHLRDPAWVILILALGHLLVVLTMKAGLLLYLYPTIPLFVLVAGRAAVHLSQWTPSEKTKKSKKAKKQRRKKSGEEPTIPAIAVGLLWSFLVIFSLIGLKSASAVMGERDLVNYSFEPHFRLLAQRQLYAPLVASYLAEYIGPKTDSNARETLFGDAIITSLVALKTGRRVAANLADMDPVWLQIGVLSREEIAQKIEKDYATYLIFGNWKLAADNDFKGYIINCYHPPREFPRLPNSTIPRLFVFRHRDQRPCRP